MTMSLTRLPTNDAHLPCNLAAIPRHGITWKNVRLTFVAFSYRDIPFYGISLHPYHRSSLPGYEAALHLWSLLMDLDTFSLYLPWLKTMYASYWWPQPLYSLQSYRAPWKLQQNKTHLTYIIFTYWFLIHGYKGTIISVYACLASRRQSSLVSDSLSPSLSGAMP